jgi:hypothetical protein
MGKSYRIFGLYIESDIALPAPLVAGPPPGLSPDVVIEYGEVPAELSNPRGKGPRYQAGSGEFLLLVDDVARYYVRDGRRITISAEPGVEEERILIFLMGSAFGALMHQRNVLILHAGAVAFGDGGVLFTGISGVGKSTLTAAFHDRGHPFLADDVCAVALNDGKPAVVPGFPRLKLWAEALEGLGKDKGQLKSIKWTENLEKYFLPVETVREEAILLKAVFILVPSDTDVIEITALKGLDKVRAIINNTYRLRFLNAISDREAHFRQCAAVASVSAVYCVSRPRSGFLLGELMDAVEAKFIS